MKKVGFGLSRKNHLD